MSVVAVSGAVLAPKETKADDLSKISEKMEDLTSKDGASEANLLKELSARKEEERSDKKRKIKEYFDSEMKQPHIFKDNSIVHAENALIFDDFYKSIWE